jgi:tetraacyldisaccharide 4'-kinase
MSLSASLNKKVQEFIHFTVDVIYGRAEGTGATIYAGFLQALSYIWSVVAQAKLWLYQMRILHDQPLGCLVVVVGNLTAGGTGKTPVVEKFARALRDRGRHVAILSRGYKSKAPPMWKKWWYWLSHTEEPPPRVVSDGRSLFLTSETAGDEPYMLARNLPGVVVIVDRNRVKAGTYAIKKYGCDTLILDDGFQYMPLKGRLNLLLVDKTNPFGNGYCLPRGVLREPVKHLQRASYVFLTKSNGHRDTELEDIIQQYNPGVDVIECAHRPQFLRRFAVSAASGLAKDEPLSYLKGRKIAAFCGIATPESFEKFLRDYGAEIVFRERFLDHYRFTNEDLDAVFLESVRAGAEIIVTTEKDAVRIDAGRTCPLPLYFLRLEIEILQGSADFDEAVSRICFPESGAARNPATVVK